MKNFLVKDTVTILDAFKALDKVTSKCLVVIDSQDKLLGTISDGDLRRAILKDHNLERPISNIYNEDPTFLDTRQDSEKIFKENFIKNKISVIPIVNQEKKVIEVLTSENVFDEEDKKKEPIEASVVIMSGGKGTRMEPFTSVLPKPLIPIENKTILEHIINQFTAFSIKDFYLTLNFKSRIIKAFFEELRPNYKMTFLEEESPLGTASSLQLLPKNVTKPFFVTNCDTLMNIDLNDFYNFHLTGSYDLSLIAAAITHNIPYGTCVLESSGNLKEISEKPSFNFLVNAGMYLVNPSVLKLIPKNKYYDMTSLIEDLISAEKNVGIYPVREDDWTDIGQWDEYKKVVKNFN